jgi:hypothetical protein
MDFNSSVIGIKNNGMMQSQVTQVLESENNLDESPHALNSHKKKSKVKVIAHLQKYNTGLKGSGHSRTSSQNSMLSNFNTT